MLLRAYSVPAFDWPCHPLADLQREPDVIRGDIDGAWGVGPWEGAVMKGTLSWKTRSTGPSAWAHTMDKCVLEYPGGAMSSPRFV